MKTNKTAICAFVISIVAICLTLFKVTPLEFSNDIYLGLLATFIGIAVTLLIGYQFFNAIFAFLPSLAKKGASVY